MAYAKYHPKAEMHIGTSLRLIRTLSDKTKFKGATVFAEKYLARD